MAALERDDQRAAGMESEDRIILYQTALRVAHQAMRSLGHDPALAQFVQSGTAADHWPEVQAACTQIAAALFVHSIDAAPARKS